MAMVRRFAEVGLSAWELICHASLTGALQVSCHLRLSVSGHRVPVMASPSGTQRAWWVLRSTPTDPFRVREYYRSHLISYSTFTCGEWSHASTGVCRRQRRSLLSWLLGLPQIAACIQVRHARSGPGLWPGPHRQTPCAGIRSPGSTARRMRVPSQAADRLAPTYPSLVSTPGPGDLAFSLGSQSVLRSARRV
jgi:hypothetical protein